MKKVNWNKLYKSIPNKVQIGNKLYYKVQWVSEFKDPKQFGEMNSNKKYITIRKKQSKKEAVLTYLHEIFHAFSDENDIKLTEKQVSLLEKKMLYYVLKSGNIFSL